MSLSVEVLNSIRHNADTEYQTRVPEATKENIAEIGRVLEEYSPAYNTFHNSLLHKIGRTYVESALFKNKLAPFKSGMITTQQDVEDIWVEAFREAEGSYDPEGGMGAGGIHPFKRRDPQDVKTMYYRMNRQDKYVITLNKDDVIRAFRSEATLSAFISAQFNSLYNGAEYDEYNHMKELLAEAIKAGDFYDYQVSAITSGMTDTQRKKACADFVLAVKKAIRDVGYVSTLYNPAGIKTKTDKSKLALFVLKDVPTHIDIDLYMQVFGPDYAKMDIPVIEVDNFGSDTSGTYALLVDRDWFKVFDNKNQMESLHNPDGLYTNYWLHIWQTLCYSKFKTAIRFGTDLITAE